MGNPAEAGRGHGDLWCERSDCVRSALALTVVLGGLLLVALVWFVPVAGRSPDGFLSALTALISGVLGWYFGSRGVDRAERTAERAVEEQHEARLQASRAEELATRVSEAGQDVDELAAEYGALLAALKARPELDAKIRAILEGIRRGSAR